MRRKMTIVIVAIAAAVTFTLPTPAAATDKAGALAGCAKNRNCGIIDGSEKHGGVDLAILQDDGTTSIVVCPAKGPCQAFPRTNPGQKTFNIRPALAGLSASSPGRPAPKPNLGPGILETGSGFNSSAPSGAGSPAGGGTPSAPKGPVLR